MLTPRENRWWQALWFGGRQNKHHMRGWLLEGFEERIEGTFAHHVGFVENVNLG